MQTTHQPILPAHTQPLHDFFDAFALPVARHYLQHACLAAESKQVFNKTSPADLLYFFECFEQLVPAVFNLVKSGHPSKQVLLPNSPDAFDLSHYPAFCGAGKHYLPWDYFPRNLCHKEYCNPYKALQKFTNWGSKKEWIAIIENIRDHALGGNSLQDMGIELEMVKVSGLLGKVVEGCYLIYVRGRVS